MSIRVTIASVLSHLVVRLRLFYKINKNKSKRKINIDLAIVASQMPGGTIHDNLRIGTSKVLMSKQPIYMVIWMRKSIWSSQKVSDYLAKKIKSGDSAKHCMALSKPACPGGAQ